MGLTKKLYPQQIERDDKGHSCYLNNLKLFLMICIVFGHFASKISYMEKIYNLYYFVYIFHMPCFVFVSGMLAKNVNKDGKFRADKIFSFLWMYIVFKFLITAIKYSFKGGNFKLNLFEDAQAPWYLLSMIFWYLMIPVICQVKSRIMIVMAFAAGLLIGLVPAAGTDFSSSKTVVFFPFFVLGFYMDEERLNKLTNNKKLRVAAASVFAAAAVFCMLYGRSLNSVKKIVFSGSPYAKLFSKGELYGMSVRAGWYIIAIILSVCVITLIPRCRLRVSVCGERTLQIYILHICIRNYLLYAGFFDYLKKCPGYINYLVIPFSVVITLILANKYIKKLFDAISLGKLTKKMLVK